MYTMRNLIGVTTLALFATLPVAQAASIPSEVQKSLSGAETSALYIDLLAKARFWKKQKRMDVASATWERVLLSNPRNEEALMELAVFYIDAGYASDAAQTLAILKQVNPRNSVIPRVENMLSISENGAVWKKMSAGDKFLQAHNFAEAELEYLGALEIYPGFPPALLGLASTQVKQKKYSDTLMTLDQHDAKVKNSFVSARIRSEVFTAKAEDAEAIGNTAQAADYYAQAKALAPIDPWVSFALARNLLKQGKKDEARKEIDRMTTKTHEIEGFYAGALFYAEIGEWKTSLTTVERVPVLDRDAPILELRNRAMVYVKCATAQQQAADGQTSEASDTVNSAEKDAHNIEELLAQVASTWMKLKQPHRATDFLENHLPLPAGLEVLYAASLLDSNQDEKLEQMFKEIDSKGENYAVDRAGLENIRVAFTVRRTEQLRAQGKLAEAQAVNEPVLANHPKEVELLLAHARVHDELGHPKEVIQDVDVVLDQQPTNHEAIRLGSVNAIKLKGYPLADSYLARANADAEQNKLYLDAAYAAQDKQNQSKADEYFAKAGILSKKVDFAESPEQILAGRGNSYQHYVEGAYGIRSKTGQAGLSQLKETNIPLALHIPLNQGSSALVLKANRVTLDAGDAGPNLSQYGRNLTNLAGVSLPVSASGTSFSIGYQAANLSADIGISPNGFLINRKVGGVRWATDVANSNISVELARRSVTESVLSYAGARDNVTGVTWGGIVKTGGQLGIYHPFGGAWAAYASAGAFNYSGTNVANNTSNNQSLSLIYELAHSDVLEANIAGRLIRSSYKLNENQFTWGHGGYYSPQRDISLTLPLHVAGNFSRLHYDLNLNAGWANTFEDSAFIFATDSALQASLPLGAPTRTQSVSYKAKSIRHLDWSVEYDLNQKWVLGNRLHFDEAPNYRQQGLLFYVRYDFDKRGTENRFPPNPIKPYYITTQGGAGHN